jgi:hypothetical protein
MPVTLLYGRERAHVARLVLSLLRTVRSAYTPELTLEQASESAPLPPQSPWHSPQPRAAQAFLG